MQLIKTLGMRYPTATSKRKRRYGRFLCHSCTEAVEVMLHDGVKASSCKSCHMSALHKGRTSHGGVGSRLYNIWSGMRSRCNNANDTGYKNYGGKGVSVCGGWDDFASFQSWALSNGYTDDLTIDRINNDLGYGPENCRFVSMAVQIQNTRRLRSTNTSGYRGVVWHKSDNKWHSRIMISGKAIHIGGYDEKINAAKAYDRYVIDNNLEHTTNGLLDQ